MDKRLPAHRETSQGAMLGSRATATNARRNVVVVNTLKQPKDDRGRILEQG